MKKMASIYRLTLSALLICGTTAYAQPSPCGDANFDGLINLGDAAYGLQFLFEGGAAPLHFDTADFDQQAFYTTHDIALMVQCIFTCGGSSSGCAPGSSPLIGPLDSDVTFRYRPSIPSFAENPDVTNGFEIRFSFVGTGRLFSFTAPFRLLTTTGLVIPIDSIVIEEQSSIGMVIGSASFADGRGIIGGIQIPGGVEGNVTGGIFIQSPPAGEGYQVVLDWEVQSPAQAPTEQLNSLYPLFVSNDLNLGFFGTFTPLIAASCCVVPGDANNDGSFNVADITFNIARIFTGGPASICQDIADANGDNSFNIADVTYGIARVFGGGPAPICGSSGG